jgi:hypothetical protein
VEIGDLVKTVYRDDYALVIKVWWATVLGQHAAQLVYPDGETGSQPSSRIREVISASR